MVAAGGCTDCSKSDLGFVVNGVVVSGGGRGGDGYGAGDVIVDGSSDDGVAGGRNEEPDDLGNS
jgi:hypothetical protein